MKAMNDYNSYISTNNSWTLTSDCMRSKNPTDISGVYKNFLDNDIDFNEQPDYGFKMQERDIFGSDLSYENSEMILSNTGSIPHGLGVAHASENALKKLQINGIRYNISEESLVKYPSTGEDSRMEEEEDYQRVPSKRIMNDFERSDFGIGWSNERTQDAKASYQLSQNEINNGIGRGIYLDEDDIHNMLATDSSLTATPLSHKPMIGGPFRKFSCELDEEMYPQSSTLRLLRSNMKTEIRWPEFQLEPATFHQDAPEFNNSSISKSNQLNYNQNSGNNVALDQSRQQGSNCNDCCQPRVGMIPAAMNFASNNNLISRPIPHQRAPNDAIRSLVHLDLEEFRTGKGSCFPRLFTVPKQLQLLIENDPEGYLQELNLPLAVADAIRASKVLKRLKFRSRHNIGTLTPEERRQKVRNHREKRQLKSRSGKPHSEARKKVADNRERQNGKFTAQKKAKKNTPVKEKMI